MIYKIYNTSDADVTISNVVFTALDYTVLLDTDDAENPVLTNGIKLADSCSSEVGVYVTDGTFTFYEDDVLQDTEEYYRIANNWIEMLKGSGTAFYDDGTGQYFDLEDKQLKIYNPVTETWETGYADGLIDYKLDISALEDGSMDITPSSISIANCVSTDAAIANYHLYDIAAGDLTTAVRVRAFGVAYAGDYSDRIEHLDVTLSCNTDGDLVVASTGMNASDTGTVVNVRAYKKDDDSFMIVAATASNVNANFVIEIMNGTSFKTCGYLNDMTAAEYAALTDVYGYSCVYTSVSKANTIFTAGDLRMDNLEDAEILGSGSRGQIFDNTSYVTSALALKADKHEIIVTNTPVDTGNIWAVMSIPHSTFTQTFGGVFFFETYSSSSGTQVAGALAIIYCNDTDTVSINSMYGSTPYYIDDGSTVTVYINCGSDDVKLRWTSPTAGDMADGRISMDWIIATPTVYTGSGMSLSTAGTLG